MNKVFPILRTVKGKKSLVKKNLPPSHRNSQLENIHFINTEKRSPYEKLLQNIAV